MERMLSRLGGAAARRNLVAGLAAAGMILAIFGMTRLGSGTDLALLYSGLDPAAAGEVVRALEARGATHEVRGPAIYVDAARRDSLRMDLAADGLPRTGSEGYELLDSLSGFGTTSQMFDAAYWRAKEGELARTLLSSPDLRAARVHISAISGRTFDRDFRPSASVALTPGAAPVSPELAKAVRFLVAAAVAGLRPEDVAVIDTRSGAVLEAEDPGTGAPSGRAMELRRNVLTLLEARVGPGRAVVELAIETVQQSESIVERQIDPATRVQISSEITEKKGSASDTDGGGDVTVSSNLPTGDGAGGGGQSQSQDSETRELLNYDVSETRREVQRAAGGIARLTVAVLVDGLRGTDPSGAATWQPRSEDELAALRDLVASAVGYDETRGDVITVRSLEFPAAEPEGVLAEAGTADARALPIDLQSLIEMAVLAAVALGLGLFVLRPALVAKAPADIPGLPPPGSVAGPTGTPAALDGTIDDGPMPDFAPPMAVADGVGSFIAAPADPVVRLRQLIADRREETVEILRSWMDDRESAQ